MKKENILITIWLAVAAVMLIVLTIVLGACSSEALHPGSPAAQGITIVIPEGYEGYLDPSAGEPAPPLKGEELQGYGNQTTAGYSGNQTTTRHCEASAAAIQNTAQPSLTQNLDCFVPRNDGTTTTSPLSGEMPASRQRGQSTPPLSGEVPATRAEGSKTRYTPDPKTGLCTWNEGDRLYICIAYYRSGDDFANPLATQKRTATRTADNTWQFDGDIFPPNEAEEIFVIAWHTAGTLPVQPVYQDDLLYSSISRTPLADGMQIALPSFARWYSRITLTSLKKGDKVEITGTDLRLRQITDNWLVAGWDYDIPAIIADENGHANLYAEITTPDDIHYTVTRGGNSASGKFTPTTTGNSIHYTIACAGLFAQGPGGAHPGDLDPDPEYPITEKARFLAWADDVRNRKQPGDFTLKENIDLEGEPFEPIKDPTQIDSHFNNTFDGGGFTISGLKIDADDNAGLFRSIGQNGKVQHLKLEGPQVKSTSTSTILAAAGITASNYGQIGYCTVTGAHLEGPNAGGVAGWNYGSVTYCTFSGTVKATGATGDGHAGGIAAMNSKYVYLPNPGAITACNSQGTISGNYAGGIAGFNSQAATLTACRTGAGTTIAGTMYAGGLVGFNRDAAGITACYSLAASVQAPTATPPGGIAGYNEDTGAIFAACHWLTDSSQPTIATGSYYTGEAPSVINCYSFANFGQFIANPNAGNRNLMTLMNSAIPAGTGWVWELPNPIDYPTITEAP